MKHLKHHLQPINSKFIFEGDTPRRDPEDLGQAERNEVHAECREECNVLSNHVERNLAAPLASTAETTDTLVKPQGGDTLETGNQAVSETSTTIAKEVGADPQATQNMLAAMGVDTNDVDASRSAVQRILQTTTETNDKPNLFTIIKKLLEDLGLEFDEDSEYADQIAAFSGSTQRGPGGYDTLNQPQNNDISGVHLFQEDTRVIEDERVQLDLRKMHRAWKQKCEEAGIVEGEDYAIMSVGRSMATHQDNLRRGTSKAQISKHCLGAAFDAVPLHNGSPRWNHADRPLLDQMGEIWKQVAAEQGIGVKWGGDWGWDPYHFELATSSSQLMAMRNQ